MRKDSIIDLPSSYTCPVRIGSGFLSKVYKAYHPRLNRMVAIKILESNEKVEHEARILSSVTIPCVPHFYDIHHYKSKTLLITEWIYGVPLNEIINQKITALLRQTIAYKLIQSLVLLHDEGFSHRDLKPENIILTPAGTVYLVDFGFASESIINSGASRSILGTPKYMPPEVWSCNGAIDYSLSDLYALGKILHEILGTKSLGNLNNLTDPDPEKRPKSSKEVLTTWNITNHPVIEAEEWNRIVSSATSEYLADLYIDSAKLLYSHNRVEEAYQILTDVLEEIPDHVESISMLQTLTFSTQDIKRRKSYLAIFLSATLLIFAVLSFQLGKMSNTSFNLPLTMSSPMDGNTKLSSKKMAILKSSPEFQNNLRNNLGNSLFKGELHCFFPSMTGRVTIDSIIYNPVKFLPDTSIIVYLEQGNHSVIWYDSLNDIRISESITILPFEKKNVRLK